MPKFKDKQILAHLVKHQQADIPLPVWYWVNPMTNVKISPTFPTRDEADVWFNDLVAVHNDTYDLLNRSKEGKIFNVKAVIDNSGVISSTKTKKCPFAYQITGDVLSVNILGTDLGDARTRLEEFFDIIDWLD